MPKNNAPGTKGRAKLDEACDRLTHAITNYADATAQIANRHERTEKDPLLRRLRADILNDFWQLMIALGLID